MKAIVAVDLNWGIGCDGQLLQHLPKDLKFFKEKTLGKVVVMGRQTFESLPGKAPLKDRINIVLSQNENFNDDRLTICRSLESVFDELKHYESDNVYIIGGDSVYKQFLPYCTEAYVTKIDHTYQADKFFTNVDEASGWELVSSSDLKEDKGVQFRFCKYVNHQISDYR